MKRIILFLLFALFFISHIAYAKGSYAVYLPLVSAPRVLFIDCMDQHGRLIECP